MKVWIDQDLCTGDGLCEEIAPDVFIGLDDGLFYVKEGDKIKTIRFGQQGVKTAGKPKAGESAKQKARRKSFKARHGKNIKKGKMSAAYWADKVKW